jgi:hypothetical protein
MSDRRCDHCFATPADVEVESVVGLEAWNRLNPGDPRTRLFFCSLVCTFLHGLELGHADGREARRRAGGKRPPA